MNKKLKIKFNKKYLLPGDIYFDTFIEGYEYMWKYFLNVPPIYVTEKDESSNDVELSVYNKNNDTVVNSVAWINSEWLIEYNAENKKQVKEELKEILEELAYSEGLSIKEYLNLCSEEFE